MPSSTNKMLHNIVEIIRLVDPHTILDCGIGFGKVGFLAREYLDVYKGNVFKKDWRVKIYGIEIFKPYIDNFTWLKEIYDKIYIDDLHDRLRDLYIRGEKFDLVVALDVIEHLEKEKGINCLRLIEKIANKCYLLSIPLGKIWIHNKVVAGNPHEKHKSWWLLNDLKKVLGNTFEYQIWVENNKEGVLVWKLV